MSKFTKELDELTAKGVIAPDVAERIRDYYKQPSSGNNRMVIAFGIIGALLVGMGVVLIIAHNWDELSNGVKLGLGFAPLAIGQAIAGYLIVKQSTSKAWTEGTAVILTFAIATSIAVVGQVYNIHGDLASFLRAWMILTLPVMYLLRSQVASLLFWIGVTWYALQTGFSYPRSEGAYYYWAFAIAALPFYIKLIRKSPNANAVSFHNWFIAISMTIALPLGHGTNGDELLIGAFVALFSSFIMIGQFPFFAERKLISNAYLVGGSAGIVILMLFLTFEWPEEMLNEPREWWISPPLFIWIGLFAVACGLLYRLGSSIGYKYVLSKSYTFIIFLLLFAIGLWNPVLARGFTNVIILALGVFTIREGAQADKLWKMNYGLLILSILIICRFFDTDMSFVIRGLLFMIIGAGFFGVNFYMMKKRKAVA
jgi:Predicted membrane protein (DUF2157)